MSEKHSICCSMIVKNAEDTIDRAIRSVIPVCRQIVVVDTGSFDSTPSIASRLGAELHFFKWNNDFSEARNYALKFPRTEWVIILDADEELITDSLIRNIHLLDNNDVGGIRTTIKNYLSAENTSPDLLTTENTSIVEHKYTRIFRIRNSNSEKLPVKFIGKIHEQISDSIIDCGYQIIDSDIIINHYGYIGKNPEKINRNLELIKSELEKNPDDLWIQFHFGETVFGSGNLNDAEIIFSKLLDYYAKEEFKNQFPVEHYEMARIRLAQIEIQKNNFQRVVDLLNFESGDFNREGFRLYLLAVSFLLSGNTQSAANLIKKQPLLGTNMLSKKQINELLTAISKIENIQNK